MQSGKFRKILLMVVIIILSTESAAYRLTSSEQETYNDILVNGCSRLTNWCDVCSISSKFTSYFDFYGNNIIYLALWLRYGHGPSCEITEGETYGAHPEILINPHLSTTPTETPTCKGGSIVNVNEGSVGESVMIVGTPFDLVYSSDRVAGNAGNYLLHIPLTGEGAIGAELRINWLGQSSQQTLFDTDFYDFTWNGLNASNQEILEPIKVEITLTHLYPGLPPERGYTIPNAYWVGSLDNRRFGLGGWSLSSMHYLHGMSAGLDVPTILYMGDGPVSVL